MRNKIRVVELYFNITLYSAGAELKNDNKIFSYSCIQLYVSKFYFFSSFFLIHTHTHTHKKWLLFCFLFLSTIVAKIAIWETQNGKVSKLGIKFIFIVWTALCLNNLWAIFFFLLRKKLGIIFCLNCSFQEIWHDHNFRLFYNMPEVFLYILSNG